MYYLGLVSQKFEFAEKSRSAKTGIENQKNILFAMKIIRYNGLKRCYNDHRKYALWRVVAPYLINIRKLSHDDALSIIRVLLDKGNKLKPLIDVNDRIKPNLNAAVRLACLNLAIASALL